MAIVKWAEENNINLEKIAMNQAVMQTAIKMGRADGPIITTAMNGRIMRGDMIRANAIAVVRAHDV